mmetsp:Transcript_17959/g.38296  ORF Transcript_17959/g.38296 Transcript_17959/m.38296 type:complete len:494 (-) Transcript_17959:131-1612(-)
MMGVGLSGSTKQRKLRSDNATKRMGDMRMRKAAARTHKTLAQFEDNLRKQEQAQWQDYDDIPTEAGQMSRPWNRAPHDQFGHRSTTPGGLPHLGRSRSEPRVGSPEAMQQADSPEWGALSLHAARPPSPLGLYDYGCISSSPRSVFAQSRQRAGESARTKNRQTSTGFYFPGTQFKKGPYGFSLLDPCLLPPKAWASDRKPPFRAQNTGDMRPLSTEGFGLRNRLLGRPHVSDCVRSTEAHARRAQLHNASLDKGREEAFLEHARFENGMFEGKWHDPTHTTRGEVLEVQPPEEHSWLQMPMEDMHPIRARAAAMLFGLDRALRKFRGGLHALFAAENLGCRQEYRGGAAGVLEPSEFMRGLVRVGVVAEGELSNEEVTQIMGVIDSGFDGRVRLPVVARAVTAARNVRTSRERDMEEVQQAQAHRVESTYHAKLPFQAVKVDKQPSSMLNFNRSFETFRKQQQGLLQFHEADAPGAIGTPGGGFPRPGSQLL